MSNLYGFIITRHVNSIKTNNYWNHSVKLLRTFYPLIKIVIIAVFISKIALSQATTHGVAMAVTQFTGTAYLDNKGNSSGTEHILISANQGNSATIHISNTPRLSGFERVVIRTSPIEKLVMNG